jgi:parallel beta-helix repeat protein
MKIAGSTILAALLAALLWLGPAPAAKAETFNCTVINTMPAYIVSPGHYCLNKNFSQDFNNTAISISSDDVVLDCNHHAIIHSNPNGLTNGIQSDSHSNVTIQNCSMSGFYVPIYLPEYSDGGSRNNRVLNNTVTKSRYTAIIVEGSNNLVEGNQISNVLENYAGNNAGIELSSSSGTGVGNVIRGNSIADFKPALSNEIYGIHFYGVSNTTIANNTIEGLNSRTGTYSGGIVGEYQRGNSITGNTVLSPVNTAAPFDGSSNYGIGMVYGTPSDDLTNLCTDNTVGKFNVEVSGCVDTGNTEF